MNQNDVPESWNLVRLDDALEILDSERIPLNSEERFGMKGSIPYYGANGVVDYINDYIFDEALILVAEDGGNFEDYENRSIAYKITGKSWVNNHAHVLRVKPGFDFDFLFYTLEHKNIVPVIKGGTRTKLNQSELREIALLVPKSLRMQQRIAGTLRNVDKTIETTEELIEKDKRIKTGLMQQLLTRGIGHAKFKQTDLGEIPFDWRVSDLSDVCRTIDCKHRTPRYFDAGYPVVRPSDVKVGPLILSNCKLTSHKEYQDLTSKYVPKRGDVVFSRNASFGVASYVDTDREFAVGQDVIVITSQINSTMFYFYVLNSDIIQNQLQRLSTGSTFGRINLGEIRKFKVPVPSKPEQDRISLILLKVDKKIDSEEAYLSELVKIKTGLMQDLLTGKVRVAA